MAQLVIDDFVSIISDQCRTLDDDGTVLQGLPAHYFKYLEEQDAADRFGYFPDDPLDNRQAVQSSEKNKQPEYESLLQNQTWKLADLPAGRRPVRCTQRYKTRLIARGYTQTAGIDYTETSSLVVKFGSIRTYLNIAAEKDLDILRFDVKTALLHGDFTEEMYMTHSVGFHDPQFPLHVCCR